ncbi:MAG: hypothetical protein R2861_03170 [Desulfobacterales bacterium]
MNEKVEKLVNQFTLRYIEALSELKNRGQRSYGFEYEFLPDREITAEDVQAVADLLEKQGCRTGKDMFYGDKGMGIAFEPGGRLNTAVHRYTRTRLHCLKSCCYLSVRQTQ